MLYFICATTIANVLKFRPRAAVRVGFSGQKRGAAQTNYMNHLSRRPKVNPLSRRPRQQRLVMAVRGAAGSGKSYFARSLADAGLGRIAIFDTERKARLLPGVNDQFDAFEIYEADELPDFIEWALTSDEAKEFNYGGYVLDSWAAYFSAKHSELLEAVRERTGDPLAQPTA